MIKSTKLGAQSSILALLMIFSSSCVPVNKLNYFNDINELGEPIANPRQQKEIKPFDKLYIKVYSIDEKTNLLFNSNDNVNSSSASSIIGYSVDESGFINYPFIGNINVGGLTPAMASLKVEEALKDYVSNASVIIKFIDSNISVMGEVVRQGTYSFTQDKITIYDALALGGGITRFGDRRKVILVRQDGNKILHYKLNLSDSRISGKEYYYLLPNDVVIVEPMKNLSYSYGNNTYSLILNSITALIAILLFAGV